MAFHTGKGEVYNSLEKHHVRLHGAQTKIEYNVKDGNYHTGTLSVLYQFTNLTGDMLYVKNQANVVMAIKNNTRVASTHPPHLEVRVGYQFRCCDSMLATRELILSMANEGITTTQEVASILAAFDDYIRIHKDRSMMQNFTYTKVIRLTAEEISISDKCYLRELDLVVSRHKYGVIPAHPNSNEGFDQHNADVAKIANTHGGVMVTIIDNKQTVPMYFMYAGKRVIEIPTVVDHSRQSGVYSWVSTKGTVSLVPHQEFMSVEEAKERLGLYASYSEAEANGNPERMMELEEARLKTKLKQKEQEIQVVKHDNQLELLQDEKSSAILKSVQAMLQASAKAQEEAIRRQSESTDAALKLLQETQKAAFSQREMDRKDIYSELEASRRNFYGDNDLMRKDALEQLRAEYDLKDKKRKNKYEKQSTAMKFMGDVVKHLPAIVLGVGALFGGFMIGRNRSSFT